ncbi:MAG: hypothetical protein KDK36_09625 [Leptospiraceae bacterium]|nr:hypothetical protein [Leptospiraceae bacterium]
MKYKKKYYLESDFERYDSFSYTAKDKEQMYNSGILKKCYIPKKIINKWILKIDYSKWENGKQSGKSGKDDALKKP